MKTQEELNKIIARVILSTKRKNRQYSLYEIASDIKALQEDKGSLKTVSDIIGISSGMLNQFLSVFKLPDPIIDLIKDRKIDSVSIAHNLSKFKPEDAIKLSSLIINQKISSQDLKVLIPYRRQHAHHSIENLVEALNATKNIKVSVIRINRDDTIKDQEELTDLFGSLVGVENIVEITVNEKNIDIKLLKDGEKVLRSIAKSKGQSLQELVSILVA